MKKYKSPEAQSLKIEEKEIAADTSSVEIPEESVDIGDDDKFFPGHW